MKKSNRFLLIASLFCALIICSASISMSAQQVKIPYVISGDGWWTGIAITNDSGDAIADMKLTFTTDKGDSGKYEFIVRAVTFDPPDLNPIDPVAPVIPKTWVDFETNLEEIPGHAIVAKTIDDFYKGSGSKTLPSNFGSIVFSNTGDEKFSVTVYIGSPDGFAFQVFESTAP